MFDLAGKVAVVTGIQGKLGPVWAQSLLDAGARVVGIDINDKDTGPVTLLRQHESGRFSTEVADILDVAGLRAAAEKITHQHGAPTIVVNNAGIDQPPGQVHTYKIEDLPLGEFNKVLQANVAGAFNTCQVFAPGMLAAGTGSVINIGSLYASVSPDERMYDHIKVDPPFLKPPAYGASKAALDNLTKYLATHWGKHGIRVNTLSPGGVLGGQDAEFKRKFGARVPLGRMAEHGDLTGPLLFLASDASSYVTGTELRVDGGYTAW